MAEPTGDGRKGGDRSDASIKKRLAELGAQLDRLEGKRTKQDDPAQRGNALGLAFRIAIELVAGVAVGVFIGWWLDWWLNTSPIFLVIFFMLGATAGILNVMRTARNMQVGSGAGTGQDLSDDDDD